MSSLTPACAWALAAKVYAVEALRSGPLDAVELRAKAAALLEHARKLDDGADLIARSQAYLDAPVKAGPHYAPRKPTRRRGTKPASLPQRLHAELLIETLEAQQS